MAATRITTQDILNDAINKDKLAIITTKGDILTYSTEPARLGLGTNGYALTAASGEVTGLLWAAVVTAASIVDSEVPGGAVDGVNAAFTLADTPIAGSVHLYKNGIRQQVGAGNDYTIVTVTITFVAGNIPQTGDVILVDYRK